MAHEYAKEAKASHDKKLKSYGAKDGGSTPKNWAGFDALNTSRQAGRAPTSSTEYEAPERRIQRKKGGAVKGAMSLKRLDKAPRKGKDMGGARVGQIPSADKQQQEVDPTTKFMQGKMAPNTMRKKGGRIAKAAGGSLEDILAGIADSIFGAEEEAPAARRPAAKSVARHAAPERHAAPRRRVAPVVRETVTEVERPLPPRRPAGLGAMAGAAAPPLHDTTYGRPDEASTRSFLDREMGRAPTSQAAGSGAPRMADTGAPDETSMRSFYDTMGIGRQPEVELSTPELTRLYARKKGGRVQDFEARSHESTAAQKRAKGGKIHDYEEDIEDDQEDIDHDDEMEDRDLVKKMVKKEALTGKKSGGRTKRADGGGAWDDYGGTENGGSSSKGGKSKKSGSVVNIVIGGMPGQQQQNGADALINAAMAAQAAGGPGAMPPPPPPPAPPPQGAPMMAPPPMMPPQMPPQAGPGGPGPMPRARGGRTFTDIKVSKPKIKNGYPALTGGSGGGKGRREKILAYGDE